MGLFFIYNYNEVELFGNSGCLNDAFFVYLKIRSIIHIFTFKNSTKNLIK
jgi:hypothetical protein